jgi:hypothetical protein
MTWSNSEVEYEGFPLLLRKPNYTNIWQFKREMTQLLTIEHLLDKVKADGLPESSYNKSLAAFDHHMCSFFDTGNEGMILLIETFAGKRIYYYYTLPHLAINDQIEEAKSNYKVSLNIFVRNDEDWTFVKEYPFEIFKPY